MPGGSYPHTESTSGYATPHSAAHMGPGVSNLERRPSFESRSAYEGAGYERQSGYGRPPAISNSLLEERQRSIVRQLDRLGPKHVKKTIQLIYDNLSYRYIQLCFHTLDSIHKDMNRASDEVSTRESYPGDYGAPSSRRGGERDKYKDSESLVYGQPNGGKENDPYYSCLQNEPKIQRDDMVNPYWISDKDLGRGPVKYVSLILPIISH